MIKFLLDNEYDVVQLFISRNRNQKIVVQLPFDQNLKRKVVVREVEDDPTQVNVFVKGSPESIIGLCSNRYNTDNEFAEFYDENSSILYSTVG